MEISKKEIAATAGVTAHLDVQELRGAEILIKALQAENVKYVWGYPGGAVLHIYDAFFKQDSIRHVLVRHEQAAVHAADGYARATGDVGVALVTSGPGVTNAVTGIATAYMDSIPMVIITGQVPTHAIGLDAFQECDTVGITRPIVKHNFLVKDARDMAMTLKKAFHIARSGRPGPVDRSCRSARSISPRGPPCGRAWRRRGRRGARAGGREHALPAQRRGGRGAAHRLAGVIGDVRLRQARFLRRAQHG
jgi:acetolactate synthase-1/2/3 large subunit